MAEWHLYKAQDYQGHCIGMVLAWNLDLAHAYWMGQGTYPHSVQEVQVPEEGHPYGVVPILVGRTLKGYDLRNDRDYTLLDNPH